MAEARFGRWRTASPVQHRHKYTNIKHACTRTHTHTHTHMYIHTSRSTTKRVCIERRVEAFHLEAPGKWHVWSRTLLARGGKRTPRVNLSALHRARDTDLCMSRVCNISNCKYSTGGGGGGSRWQFHCPSQWQLERVHTALPPILLVQYPTCFTRHPTKRCRQGQTAFCWSTIIGGKSRYTS